MKSILENRPHLEAEINKVAEVAGYLWQKGWAERNGGNITVNITEWVDDEIRKMPAISEVKPIGVELPQLKGCYFYCKGTQKRMRDLARHPMANGSVIRICEDCASYVIIADEPTPGMDLALAKQAMQDFRTFADDGNGVLLITHDLELALEVADRIVVFYAGTTVEEAKVTDFADETLLRHPYTRALYEALPGRGFAALPGTQPYVKDLPAGCPFAPRCADRREACDGEIPVACVRGGRVRCILYTENS